MSAPKARVSTTVLITTHPWKFGLREPVGEQAMALSAVMGAGK
ncbi:hypothetical protein BKA01_007714 [Pseudonocardia eucalypti]|nr:hypothetical protein [Pseudonocardia eucalypti]